MLTGKAKSDFKKWLLSKIQGDVFENIINEKFEPRKNFEKKLTKIIYYSVVQEWLDSVGLYIYLRRDNVAQQGFNWSIESKKYGFHNLCNNAFYFDRIKATEQAIIKANEIYNSQ